MPSTPPAAPEEDALLRWTLLLLAPLVLVPVLGPFALPFWLPWLGYSLSSLSSLWHRPRRPRRPRRDQPPSLEVDGSGSLRVNGVVRR
jgi:hypothetical protein